MENLPLELRLYILSYADLDTKRYAGLDPKRISEERKKELQILLDKRQVEYDRGTCFIKLPRAQEDPYTISHYNLCPERYKVTRANGRVIARDEKTVIMYNEYEEFKYNNDIRLYEPTLRLSAI